MSTMTIDIETFKNLAHTLAGVDYTGNGQKYQHVGHCLVSKGNENGFNGYQPNNRLYDGLTRFMGGLYLANHRAYKCRYKEKEHIYFNFRSYNPKPKRLDIYQVLKSLQAIKYNLDDYQNDHLNKLIDLVKDAILDNTEQYNNAIWG